MPAKTVGWLPGGHAVIRATGGADMPRCGEHEAGCCYKWLGDPLLHVRPPLRPPPATRRAKGCLCASCDAVRPEEEVGCSEGPYFTPMGLAGPPNTCESGARFHRGTSDLSWCHLFLSLLFGKLALS